MESKVGQCNAMDVLQPYRVRLSGFFDIMCRDDDGLLASFCDMNQMIPYTLSEKWIDANCRLVENQKLRIVHECDSERNTTLLTTAKILHETIL